MSALTVDQVYNQAQQLSPADKQQLFDRLRQDIAPTPPSTFRNDEELQQMLQAGLDSGQAVPMTPSDWQDIREEVRARATQRPVPSSPIN